MLHLERVDVLQVGFLGATALQELLDLLDLLGDLHHSEIAHFLLSLLGTPFQVLSQVDDFRME